MRPSLSASPTDSATDKRVASAALRPLINSVVYTVSNALVGGIGLLLIPVYTRFMSTEQYGTVGVVMSVSTIAGVFFTLGIDASIIRFYFRKGHSADYHRRLYGTLLSVILVLGGGGLLLLLASARVTIVPFVGEVEAFPCVYLGLITVASQPLFVMLQRILKAQQCAIRYAVHNVARFLIQTGFVLAGVVWLGLGAAGILGASALTGALFWIYALVILVRRYGVCIDKGLLRECSAYSLPLVPNRFSAVASASLNHLLVNSLKSAADVGILHVATQFGSVLKLLVQSSHEAYLPWCFDQLEHHGLAGRARIIRVSKQMLIGFSTVAFVASLFCREAISIIVAGRFVVAWQVFPLLAFAWVFHLVKNVWLVPLLYNKSATKYAPACTYTNLLLMVGLSVVLIPRYGFVGAGISTLSARLLSSLVMMHFSRLKEPLGYRLIDVYLWPLLLFAAALVCFVPLPHALAVKALLAVVACLVCYRFLHTDVVWVVRVLSGRSSEDGEGAGA